MWHAPCHQIHPESSLKLRIVKKENKNIGIRRSFKVNLISCIVSLFSQSCNKFSVDYYLILSVKYARQFPRLFMSVECKHTNGRKSIPWMIIKVIDAHHALLNIMSPTMTNFSWAFFLGFAGKLYKGKWWSMRCMFRISNEMILIIDLIRSKIPYISH